MRQIGTLLLVFSTILLSAQTRISGRVTDPKGDALEGANMQVKDSYDGTSSGADGHFSFDTYEKGNGALLVSLIGYKRVELPIVMGDSAVYLDIVLREEINELKAVVISAGSFEASDKKRATSLSLLDIVTTAGAEADISATLQTVPGVQKVGDMEGIFVRGGGAEEAKIIIDGAVVNNFYYSSIPGYAQRGRFSPFLFSGTSFASGGYSALYGQALSAVLNLESVDIPNASELQFGVSPIFGSVGFQKVNKDKTTSFGTTYAYANLDLYLALIPQRYDVTVAPISHDGDFNFRHRTRSNGMYKFYASFSKNKQGIRTASLDSLGTKESYFVNNFNLYTNTSYRQPLGRRWHYHGVASFSSNTDDVRASFQNADHEVIHPTGDAVLDAKTFALEGLQQMWQLRSVVEKKFGILNAVRFGGEVWYNKDRRDIESIFFTGIHTIGETFGAGFAEADIYLTNDIAFRPGIRGEYSDLIRKWNVAPRASVSYKLAPQQQLTVDYGIFYQTPERKYLNQQTDIGYSRADHYILTYQWLTRNYTLRIQAYDKEYIHLTRTDEAALNAVSNEGFGYARGVEMFWRDRKTFDGFNYWVSYSYLDTERNHLNFPKTVRPDYAATHTASLVLKKFWVRKMFGVNWSYTIASGRPYYNPNLGDSEFMSQRTGIYQGHNVSFNWITKILKSNAVVVMSINNVFNNKQVYGYQYSARVYDHLGQLIHRQIEPPAPRTVFLGVFMSWGVDRTQQNIDGNL